MAQATGCRRIVLPMLTTIFSVVTAASFARCAGFFCLPRCFGVLAFQFLFLPHPRQDILL